MPLSVNKLEKFLSSHGLVAKKFYTMDDLIVYIEVLSISTADSFMLYIPSKYKIQLSRGTDVYQVKYMDVEEDGYIPSDYAGDPDNFELEKEYDEIDISMDDSDTKNRNMENKLEENYNHQVSLKDTGKGELQQLREIFRQLRRLKFCVQSLKYKLCVIYKNFICCIRRDDTFEGFIITDNFSGSKDRKMLVTIDLESFYDKINSLTTDIKTVRHGIYRVLDKNQDKHARNLQKMMEQKVSISTFSDSVSNLKKKYYRQLTELEKLLENVQETEKANIELMIKTDEKYANSGGVSGVKDLHNDIEKSHQMAKYESEMSKINLVKQELIKNILIVKNKHDSLALQVDNIVFDNIIMVDAILKNFIKLNNV